eukprot:CAMPEP_0198289434 /NCGR_PEP_ID=MMETSP1449-20131203/7610_1 /TAXON_ID=420275 /ORGANISM="Attheya septentrionalis, Strain CCMP2084" /LENGTH=117 /DNA_ID=CAMNT_0043987751 /DNA_START=115 /DNA_END=468 /DNA_ORIENTATION=+
MMMRTLILLLVVCGASAFVTPAHLQRGVVATRFGVPSTIHPSQSAASSALFAKKDASRSGNKRERLDKLAALEEEMVETDKSFVLQAAGGFVAILVVLGVIAASSGVLDPVINSYGY